MYGVIQKLAASKGAADADDEAMILLSDAESVIGYWRRNGFDMADDQ